MRYDESLLISILKFLHDGDQVTYKTQEICQHFSENSLVMGQLAYAKDRGLVNYLILSNKGIYRINYNGYEWLKSLGEV